MIDTQGLSTQFIKSMDEKVINRISPSQLGKCMRMHFLKIKHVEATTPPSDEILSTFQVGFVWEKYFEDMYEWAKKKGHIKAAEYQVHLVDEELNMEGTADFLITDDSEVVVRDTKTMRSEWFWYLKKTDQSFLENNEAYMYQVVAYILMLQNKGYILNRGALDFISKNDGYGANVGHQVVVDLTPEREKMVRDRIAKLNGYLERNELPPCECEGWKMEYCDYGNPNTQQPNKKKKLVNTECCMESLYAKR